MNNFNALNQYIASMNQAVNAVMKSNLELSTRIKAIEISGKEAVPVAVAAAAPASAPVEVDVDEKVAQAVTKVKTELLNSIESLIATLDVDKKIDEAITKLRQEINQAVNVDLTLTESEPSETVAVENTVTEEITPTSDNSVVEVKEEKKKKSTKKR